MAIPKKHQPIDWASIQIRATYSSGYHWAVIEREPMKIQMRLKPTDGGYMLVYRLLGTNIELPFNNSIVICRTKADCDPVIMEQNIINMLEE